MLKTIVDTDILSEIFKQRDAVVLAAAERYIEEHGVLTFVSVSLVEILSGLYARDSRRRLVDAQTFLDAHEQLLPNVEDYKLSASIIGALIRQGRPIGSEDPLIAACAINRNLPLATGNVRHYKYVADAGYGLILQNWREDGADAE